MSLRTTIKEIQNIVGVGDDGIFGPITAKAVRDKLVGIEISYDEGSEIDERTARNIATLLPRAHGVFEKFHRLAAATAATMGCEYIMISGNRTWDEQQKLYNQGRTTSGNIVTNAKPGSSWHNMGLAGDYGVFKDGDYLDSTDPKLARRVHIACSKHAKDCGLTWGGTWKKFKDLPHYQLKVAESLSTARKLYLEDKWA